MAYNFVCFFLFTGLHLRSIEEPQYKMPAEGGGNTNLGLEHNRSGIPLSPLQLPSNHHHQLNYDAEFARMESWLDENQDFAQDYFIRKATRNVVDAWLVSHATPTTTTAMSGGNEMMLISSPTHVNPQCSSRGGSGATTPVR